jgi:hypothetical protein
VREFLAAVLLAATPVPSAPPADQSGPPLREIGRVRAATPFCKAVVEKSATAVGTAFDTDNVIALIVSDMRRVDLDSSILKNRAGIAELFERYATLGALTEQGDRDIRALRTQIKESTDDDERADLSAFANSLAGAIGRQRQLRQELANILSTAQSMDPQPNPIYFAAQDHAGGAKANSQFSPGAVSSFVRNRALNLSIFTDRIAIDEATSGDRVAKAFAHCDAALPEAPTQNTLP